MEIFSKKSACCKTVNFSAGSLCDGFEVLDCHRLSEYSTLRIGGIAEKIAVITDERQLFGGILDKPHVVVGAGSNVLFSDDGYDGLIILLKNDYLKHDDVKSVDNNSFPNVDTNNSTILSKEKPTTKNNYNSHSFITVGAGSSLIKTARKCADLGLLGLEWACGIPASVGGAICMNAGAHGGSISDVLHSVRVLKNNKIVTLKASECGFLYRTSVFKNSDYIILSATFRLSQDDPTVIKEKMTQNLLRRKSVQPAGCSVGSVFKNGDKPSGYYIDQAGLKGTSVGALVVSEKHANFIINRGGGTAKDFLTLVNLIKDTVHKKFGVLLQEEFIKIGNF